MVLSLAVLLLCPDSRAGEEKLFNVRKTDIVYFRDGSVVEGRVTDTDNPDVKRVKDQRKGFEREFKMADVKQVYRQATTEDELQRLQKDYAGNPEMLLRVAKEGVNDWPVLTPKIIGMLEKQTSARNPDLLAFLCELYLDPLNLQPGPALKTAEALVSLAPAQARSYLLRGKANVAADDLAAAEKDLDKAFKMAPDNQDVLVTYADFLLRSGRPEKARELFATALGKDRRNVAALVGQGMVLLKQGDLQQAEQSFKDALAIDEKKVPAKLGLAAVRIMTGKLEEAYGEASSVLNLDTHCAEAKELQAFAKLLAGDRDSLAAFTALAKDSLNERPNQPRLLLATIAALERGAKLDEALDTVEGLAAAKQKREEAKAKYAEFLESNPSDSYLQYFIGEKKFRSGEFAGAEKALRSAARLAPRYAPVQAAVGAVSLKLDKWDAALEAYSEAIKLDDTNGEYHAGKGLALLKKKRFEEAAEEFHEARKLDRRNVSALCGLGYIANYTNNKNSAVELFQQALAVDGSCSYAAQALEGIYKQENMALEYLTFSDNQLPPPWRTRAGIAVKPSGINGQVVFSGQQGAAQGGKVEIYRELKAEEFVRLEADLDVQPQSPVTFGLRLSSAMLAGANFEVEFGKDETNEIKVRFKDFGGQPEVWQSLRQEWPAEGRVRLGMDTEELKSGKIRLWVNGKKIADLTVVLQKLSRVTAGAFVQVPPKEAVQAALDNLVLVMRGAQAVEKETEAIKLNVEDEKKPPQPPQPPGDKKPDSEKKTAAEKKPADEKGKQVP